MTDTTTTSASDALTGDEAPLLELEGIGKFYGNIIALQGVTTMVEAGKVTCVLGDNGAGKSTFIKILAGVHRHDAGKFKLEGKEVNFGSPREALEALYELRSALDEQAPATR